MVTMSEWLVKAFWLGFAKWIERNPTNAEERISVLFAAMIERIVAAEEEAAAAAAADPSGGAA